MCLQIRFIAIRVIEFGGEALRQIWQSKNFFRFDKIKTLINFAVDKRLILYSFFSDNDTENSCCRGDGEDAHCDSSCGCECGCTLLGKALRFSADEGGHCLIYQLSGDERYYRHDEVHIDGDVKPLCEKFRIDGYCAGCEEVAKCFAASSDLGCVEDDLAYDSADCCGNDMPKADIELYAECY